MGNHGVEIAGGKRFEFGQNWTHFLWKLNDHRIVGAALSLKKMLGVTSLQGKRFLDIGCGSGLFSLAARQLGAKVHSFDYDPQSVACTQELRKRYCPEDIEWRVELGSALDTKYIRSLGTYDVVYSWGVLHHTGAMWEALENAAMPVAKSGLLYIAIYNDQGVISRRWLLVKQFYNRLPKAFQFLMTMACFVVLWGAISIRDLLRMKPFSSWRNYGTLRGMSPWHDLVDWIGGLPFEVARPDKVIEFYVKFGFTLVKLIDCEGKLGCNQFVFTNEGICETKNR